MLQHFSSGTDNVLGRWAQADGAGSTGATSLQGQNCALQPGDLPKGSRTLLLSIQRRFRQATLVPPEEISGMRAS